jgi:hypothetical protein
MRYFLILFFFTIHASSSPLQTQLKNLDKREENFISMLKKEYEHIKKKREIKRKEILRQERIEYALTHEVSLLSLRLKYLLHSHMSYVSTIIEKEKARREELRRIAKRKQRKLLAKIDISKQRMHVYRGDRLLHTWKISSGKKGHSTPRGRYKDIATVKEYRSKKYNNAPMPHSVFFRNGYAIHGTNSINRLGKPASHGCVRLHPKNAKKFYSLVRRLGKKNTTIHIQN